MKKPKIATACFMHETNTFNPTLTPVVEFELADGWPAATRGTNVLSVLRKMNLATGGFITEGTDLDLVPIIWASAEPGGLVSREAFETYTDEIIDGLRAQSNLDGVLLELHGAMVSQDYDDGELEVVRRVREVVGNIPIVVALDFHANISPEFVDACDAITIYREYPHLDMADCGQRAVKLLRLLLEHKRPFSKSFKQVPFLIPLSSQATDLEPFASLYSQFDDLGVGGLLSADAAAGFPAADIPNAGPSVLAYAWDQASADQAAQKIYDRFMAAESSMGNNLLTPETAIRQAAEILCNSNKPVILADVQDNPGAGATSDTTGILHELIRLDLAPSIVGIMTDVACIDLAWQSGKGGIFETAIGDSIPVGNVVTTPLEYEVIMLSDQVIPCTGEMYAGTEANIGRTALLKVIGTKHDIFIVVAEKRFQCLDLGLLRYFDLTLENPQIIVVKSTAHFRADFDPIGAATLLVKAPGLHPCLLADGSYSKLRSGVRV